MPRFKKPDPAELPPARRQLELWDDDKFHLLEAGRYALDAAAQEWDHAGSVCLERNWSGLHERVVAVHMQRPHAELLLAAGWYRLRAECAKGAEAELVKIEEGHHGQSNG